MYSFYGGKQGRTYHIVARFDTLFINFNDKETYPELIGTMSFQAGKRFQFSQGNNVNVACFVLVDLENITLSDVSSLEANGSIVRLHGMVNEFMKGGSYTDVNYGEYVIIDTILNMSHKNDDLNGLLYRRGFDFTEGANSSARPVKADYWTEDKNHQSVFNLAGWTAAWRNYITRPGGGAEYVGQIVGPQGDSPELRGLQWQTFETLPSTQRSSTTASRTPGYIPSVIEGEASTFHDVIQFGWSNIEDADGNIEGAYIAFDIPYTVHEFNLFSTDPYSTASLVEDGTSTGHNFYYKWNLTLPAGKKGDDINNFVLEQASTATDFKHQIYNDIIDGDTYLTYTKTSYKDSAAGASTAHLGRFPWRVIKEIISNSTTRTYFEWPEGTDTATAAIGNLYPLTNSDDGFDNNNFTLICTNYGTVLPNDLPNFQVEAGMSIQGSDENGASWLVIQDPPEIASANQLQIDYKAGISDTIPYRQVDYFYIDSLGTIYVKYSDEDLNTLHSIGNFKSISNIQFDDNNQLVITYNNNDTFGKYIKQITNVTFDNALDGSQKFIATYKGDPQTDSQEQKSYINDYEISSAINTVVAIDRKGDNIIILYSNKEYRQSFLDPSKQYVLNEDYYLLPYNVEGFVEETTKGDPTEWGGEPTQGANRVFVWVNFGSLGSQYHVFGNYTVQDVLNEIPDGFEGDYDDRAGWIISVSEDDKKSLYAYNYHNTYQGTDMVYISGTPTAGPYAGQQYTTKWYKLKELDSSVIDPLNSVYLGPTPLPDNLNKDGLGFIVTNTNHSH